MEVAWNKATPKSIFFWIFPEISHPMLAWSTPMAMETPIVLHVSRPQRGPTGLLTNRDAHAQENNGFVTKKWSTLW